MDSRKYDAILAVSECGSVTAAARKLGCTYAALSHMIARTEKELGVALLAKENGTVCLSECGERIAPAIHDLLEADKKLSLEIESIRKKRNDRIRIVSCSELAEYCLPEVISAFLMFHPELELEIQQTDDPHLMHELLHTQRADFAFCSRPLAECEWNSLGKSQLFAILPQLGQGETLPKLHGKSIMLPSTVCSDELVQTLYRHHAATQVSTTSLDYPTIVQMVEHHLAISILPGLCMREEKANIALLPIEPCLYQEYGVATCREREQSKLGNEFLSFASQKLSAQIA